MLFRGSFLQAATRLAVACLTALSPALCCCGFTHQACGAGTVGMERRAHGEPRASGGRAEHHADKAGCCDEGSDESEHGHAPSDGCGCPKAPTQLAAPTVDAPLAEGPALLVAWLPVTGLPVIDAARPDSLGRHRVERPAPIPLVRLRVLRL